MPTSQELNYILTSGDNLLKISPFTLDAGQSRSISTDVASGSEISLIADQEVGHPFGEQVFAVANCTGDESQYIEVFNGREVNESPSLVSVCTANIGSYNPNDKSAIPSGWGDEHFIPSGQSLDYKIRFQNTGTDTAFTVVIRDTIVGELDMATFNAGMSSHDYTVSIEEENILIFTFDNILLPDSTTNLIESNGYVDFSINQISDNIPGTKIENTAAIFFDFNEAIITNTVFQTIETPITYSMSSVILCANETYDGINYTKDTMLSILHESPLLDSFEIVDIKVLPVDFISTTVDVEHGEIINNTPLFSDTTILESYNNSFGCDSRIVVNYVLDQINSVNLLDESDWEIIPNPTNGDIFIKSRQTFLNELYQVSVSNITGAKVYENMHKLSANESILLNLNEIPASAYFLSVSSEEGIFTEKIVINP